MGCAPSHGVWSRGLDSMVGTKFNDHIYQDCHNGCGDSYWSPSNKNEEFDKVIAQENDKRYYITWERACKYSILVSESGIIKSWRYETNEVNSCYVY